MSQSALDIIRELGYRWNGLVLATPDGVGGQTTLIDSKLDAYFPETVDQFNVWVYGGLDVPAANVGIERQAVSWAQTSHTLTFYSAWPATIIASGTYEIYRRVARGRLVAALNAAIGQLEDYWHRTFIDESIVTVQGQYRYVLPRYQNWISINRIELQMLTQSNLVGYPYEELEGWNIEEDQTGGVQTFYLQFSDVALPAGRRLRIHGEGSYPEIEADTDTLELVGGNQRRALEWVYDYAGYKLDGWLMNEASTLDQQKLYAKRGEDLQGVLEDIRKKTAPHQNVRIMTPLTPNGRLRRGGGRDPRWIGAAWSQANH